MSLDSHVSQGSEGGELASEAKTKMPAMRITKLKLSGRNYSSKEESTEEAETFINAIMTKVSRNPVEEKVVSSSVSGTLQRLPGKFLMKIFYVSRTSPPSKLLQTVGTFFASEDGTDQSLHSDIHIDIILFLVRHIYSSGSDSSVYFPEIFALTSGRNHSLLKEHVCDEEFPIKCARRVLKFNLKSLSSKHISGPTSSSALSYRPDEGTMITFWDYLGQITTSIKMPLKDDASLYSLNSFQTKRGKPSKVSMIVGDTYIKISRQMSLKDIAIMFYRLSHITRGRRSNTYPDNNVETDDVNFAVFSQVKVEKKSKTVEKMNTALKERLTSHLKNPEQSLNLRLSHRNLDDWNDANRFILKMKTPHRPKLQCLKAWDNDPPRLDELMQVVRDAIDSSEYDQVIDRLFVEFFSSDKDKIRKKRFPLLTFLEGHCSTAQGLSMFCYCGKWLKIENEYMVNLEDQFSQVELHNRLSENILSLPWTCVSDEEKMPTRQQTFEGGLFLRWMKQILHKDSNLDDFNMKAGQNTFKGVKMDDYMENLSISFEERARQLFLRMLCQQAEEHYNEGYILYDQLVSDNTSGYLLGDRIFVFGQKNIELYDILYYTEGKTYLIHVKEGFGNSTRDACSQIRISAEFVFRYLLCNNSFDILASYWSRLTKGGGKYRQVVRDRYLKLGEDGFYQLFKRNEIIFVLAYRDAKITTNNDSFVPYPKERLSRRFGDDLKLVTEKLLACNYLKEIHGQPAVTDKVFKPVEQAREEIQLKSKKDAQAAFNILKETMSSHSSFIAKMEVVHLFSHFRNFVTAGKRLSLKMCRLQTSFE
ncbi:uncharacterized protein LOC124145916 [Haliotis rufescens]|uniref:uncharacterized protein LOC124145916 n=1 Tax=Haliotis rufescens TaxID=6454 RepID=UPI00201F79C3|nr:uncharacterized protein LOC124145916 [Haliotis rufescens]XP_048239135.1 uncharacterized protein LOC124145916 [Haliotis rufescens]